MQNHSNYYAEVQQSSGCATNLALMLEAAEAVECC